MRPGKLIAGRFLILRLAASGEVGTVYLATDQQTDAAVALKILRARSVQDRARFAKECRLLASLDEPGIVQYVDHGISDDGLAYLAMEWIDGQNLAERLRGGPLGIREGSEMARLIALALGALHAQGVVHRDLKPANVALVNSDPLRPKLLDFGIVHTERARITVAGSIIGTPGYMSPEQARGERDVDARADVFALGCLLFRCLTGEPPFRGEENVASLLKVILEDAPPLRDLLPDAPPWLEHAVDRMLQKDPDARPANGYEAAALLLEPSDGDEEYEPVTLSKQVGQPICLVVGRFSVPIGRVDRARRALLDSWAVVEQMLARFGGRLQVLLDGTLVVSFAEPYPDAANEARRAACCALALRDQVPELRLAVATGVRTSTPGRSGTGATIDRAAGLLTSPHREGTERILVDQATALLIEPDFNLEPYPDGSVLHEMLDH